VAVKLDKILFSDNVAEFLNKKELDEIASNVYEMYEVDLRSRTEWEEKQDKYMKLALQVIEEKTSPWQNAANVKYPLLTTATMQFGARAYPGLISSPNIVKGRVTGFDPTGEKALSAERVGKHMSYQLIEENDEWEEDMDRLCLSLPIVGCMFKKTYFSPSKGRNVSELIYPKDLVVNYWTKRLKDSPCITHKIPLSDNEVYERINSGLFLDQEYRKEYLEGDEVGNEIHGVSEPEVNSSTPILFLEQHTYLDLDGDGYKEPYIITVGDDKVARIVASFSEEDIIYSEINDKIVRINRTEYFTKYGFVPNPDGSFYDIGFGLLLGPINETINTTINQLLDAGTLSNRQSGFLGRGLRLKGGDKTFMPGEWKQTLSSGDDLRKSIVPLPTREPSNVLFSLLGLMIESGKELSNTVPMLLGQNPGQNQPATTSLSVIDQGLKVYSAILKRMHRSLKYELKKLKRLNKKYLPPESYFQVLDNQEGMEGAAQIFQIDYSDDYTDVQPYSDPNIVSEAHRMIKAEQISNMLAQGLIPNPAAGAKIILEAMDLPNIQELLTPPEPQPDPKVILEQQKLQQNTMLEQAKLELDYARLELEREIAEIDEVKKESEAVLAMAKAEAAEVGIQIDTYRNEIEEMKVKDKKDDKNNEGKMGGVEGE